MVDFVMRQGDELPQIERTITLDGAAVDLTGFTVEFALYTLTDTEVFKRNASVISPTAGSVKYAFTTTDTALMAPDFYKAMFIATNGTLNLSAPNEGFISIQITSLASGVATYTGSPGARALDTVRFLSQDTDTTAPRLSDAEITWLLTEWGDDVYEAAASACETTAATYASYRDKTVGPLSISYGNVVQSMYALAGNIRKRKSRKTGFAPVMTQESTDHLFEIGMHDIDTATNPLTDGALG